MGKTEKRRPIGEQLSIEGEACFSVWAVERMHECFFRNMVHLARIGVLLFLFLSACRGESKSDSLTPETGQGGVLYGGAGEGEFCGGIAAFPCEEGLTCKYDGEYPDAGGTCVSE